MPLEQTCDTLVHQQLLICGSGWGFLLVPVVTALTLSRCDMGRDSKVGSSYPRSNDTLF